MILPARHHHVEIQSLIERLILEQPFSKRPRTQRGRVPGGGSPWYKLDASTFVIDSKRSNFFRSWGSKTYRCRQNPQFGQLLDMRSQHSGDYAINGAESNVTLG